MTPLRCSHVWFRVADLHAAVRDLTGLGFSVAWGADPATAHNALIWFREGPFVELAQVPRALRWLRGPLGLARGRATGERMAWWAAGPGRDLALETDETTLDGVRTRLRGAGVRVGKVCPGSRTRPDGATVRYQYLAVRPARLPFVVSTYDPPQRPADVRHPNGASGIQVVHYGLAARDRATFAALVGDPRWIVTHDADRSGVRGVEVDGLTGPLDGRLLHGLALSGAAR